MAITFFGVASTPADNGTQAGPGAVTITPPSSMAAGDLVLVHAYYRGATSSIMPRIFDSANAATQHGGQQWNWHGTVGNTHPTLFWCRFNGTWSADPGFVVNSGTNAYTLVMVVFRPTSSSKHWRIDVGPNSTNFAAPGSPFTVTIPGVTTVAADTVTVAWWSVRASNTWGTLSGSGWSQSGLGAQYRNTTSSTSSVALAYNIKTSAGATNDVSLNQSAGTIGEYIIASFKEVDLPSGGPVGTVAYVQSAGNSNEGGGSSIAATFGAAVTSGNAVVGYAHFETGNPLDTVTSISDNQGNSYDIPIWINYAHLAQASLAFWLPDITNGPTTVTVTFTGTPIVRGIIIHEVSGIGSIGKLTGIDWQPQGAPANLSTLQVTPAENGHYLFGGVHVVGAPTQDTDYFNAQGSWTERLERLGVTPSRPPLATYDQVQGTAAAIDFDVNADTDGEGYNLIMATFAPATSQAVSRTPTAGSAALTGIAPRNDRGIFVPTEVDI